MLYTPEAHRRRYLYRVLDGNGNFCGYKVPAAFLKEQYASPEIIGDIRARSLEAYNIRGNVIKDFVELDEFDGRLYIACEFYDEKQLFHFLEQGYSLSLVQICRTIRMFAQGLHSFHSVGLVYGNLTPENVIVEIRGRELVSLKLLKPSVGISNGGGNIFYYDPEYRNRPQVANGDLYAVGIHVVRFITGKFPYADQYEASGKPSLRYVTNALFRRAIPEKLVRIVLRLLHPDRSYRYASCNELLRDLRDFMSLPDDAGLGGRITDAQGLTILAQNDSGFRAFASNEYFHSISEESVDQGEANKRVYPVQTVGTGTEIDIIEEAELRIQPGEESWSIDEYVEHGKKDVAGIIEGLDEKAVDSELVKTEVKVLSGDHLAEKVVPEILPPVGDKTGNTPATKGIEDVQTGARVPLDGFDQVIERNSAAQESRDWNYHRIQAKDIIGIISRSAKVAGKGHGSFRYIQDPEGGYANTGLFTDLQRLSSECLYVNAGSFARYGNATVNDFLAMVKKTLPSALVGESRAALSSLSSRVARADSAGLFTGIPLERKRDRKRTASASVEPTPVQRECAYDSIIMPLCAFARKKRPLALIFRSGEHITRELHDLMRELSSEIANKPVCVVVFFDFIRFESWHTLSRLETHRGISDIIAERS